MLQSITVGPKSKRRLNAVSWVLVAGLFAADAVFDYHRYQTTGNFVMYGYSFSGSDAQLALLGMILIALTLCVYAVRGITRVTNEPEEYAKRDAEREYWICARCCQVFTREEGHQMCPRCNSTDIEQLSGYYERHPERKEQACPSDAFDRNSENKPS